MIDSDVQIWRIIDILELKKTTTKEQTNKYAKQLPFPHK